MKLYGTTWSRRDLNERVGRLEQIGGVRRLRAVEGFEAGLDTVQVRTGAGLEYFVNPSRGLDISLCQYGGTPLSWQAPAGDVAPAYYRDTGLDWLRTACGGLLMTCGLRQAGAPCEDNGEPLGLHGRAHHTPARHVAAAGCWEGDEYVMRVSGLLEEVRCFGEHLALRRVIESRMGANEIRIRDTVENAGVESSPLMLLYHFNFGFPLLAPELRIDLPACSTEPRDAETPATGFDRWEAPAAGFRERVYCHSGCAPDADGFARATLFNPAFPVAGKGVPLRVTLGWKPDQLPWLVQWKMCGQKMHVLGIEPSNCRVGGRAAARAAGELQFIEPGEKREFETILTVA